MSQILLLAATKGNNLELARSLQGVCEELKLACKVASLEDFDMPLYTPTAETQGIPAAASDLAQQLKAARAVIWLTPEYNGSIPPIASNAIAWVSRTSKDWREGFNGKFMVVATHSGGGGQKVVEAMRSQLQHLGAIVLPRVIITTSARALNSDSARDILTQLAGLAD